MSWEETTIGPCRLIRADCLEVLDAMRPDCVITDPPYGVAFKGKATKHTTKRTGGYNGGDDSEIGPEVIRRALPLCLRALVFSGIARAFGYPPPQDIGSVFCPSGAGIGKWGFVCMHPVLLYGKRPRSAMYPTSITSFDIQEPNGHPCPKPIEWMEWAVGLASVEGETVLDPFMGSGTTGVACVNLGRQFIGIEIDPTYYAIAVKRIRRAWQDKCSELPFEKPPTEVQPQLFTGETT